MFINIELKEQEIDELNELLKQLKQIEIIAEKSRKEKKMGEIVAIIIFLLTGSVMFYIGSGIIGYVIWIALYGFLLYYIFVVRKKDVPEYETCVRAAKFIVSDCIKIIERKEVGEIIYNDPEFYIEKYNKLIKYYPDIESKSLRSLIYKKTKE